MHTTLWRLAAWTLLLIVILATLSPIGLRPHLSDNADLERALALLALGVTFGCGYPRRIWLVAILLLVGIFGLEWSQQLLIDRHGRLADAMVKAAAALIGLTIGWMVSWRARLPRARRPR